MELIWDGKGNYNYETHKKLELVENSSSDNMYIEGDNLDALILLQKDYTNKIKMIYIDPPYNTGKRFIYNDNYRKRNDKHSDWLNMMYPRLKIARNLLRDDGVIFISIDDNEVHNLRKICDEIFGEDNFVGMLSVENNPKGRKNSKFISITNEYCLIYSKNINDGYFIENIPKDAKDMEKDENGIYVHNSGKRVLVGENKFNVKVSNFNSNKHYTVYYNQELNDIKFLKETELSDKNNKLLELGYKRYVTYLNDLFVYNTYTDSRLNELFKEKRLEFKNDKIYEKNTSNTIRIKSLLINKKYKAIIDNKKVDFEIDLKTTSAKQILTKIIDCDSFSYPKNTSFIKLLIGLIDNKNSIILDFFSGSATTAHAVMELNSQDGGNRKFIMVQLPEQTDKNSEAFKAGYKNICEIGKERIRRAGNKLKENNPTLDTEFKVFKIV